MLREAKTFLNRRLMRKLVTQASREIYSEQFDIAATLSTLSGNKEGVALLRAYVAIQTATRLTEPLADADVDRAVKAIDASAVHLRSPRFDAILDVHKELAEVLWQCKHLAILKGKLALKESPYSYEAAVYSLESARNGPSTSQERAKYEGLSKQISDLDHQIEERELEALRRAGDAHEYEERREEQEVRALREEVDVRESDEGDRELKEAVSMLELKLGSLLRDADP